jgi:hypothetical protein
MLRKFPNGFRNSQNLFLGLVRKHEGLPGAAVGWNTVLKIWHHSIDLVHPHTTSFTKAVNRNRIRSTQTHTLAVYPKGLDR